MEKIRNIFLRRFELFKTDHLKDALTKFSFTERLIFWVFGAILTISVFAILLSINNHFLVEVPAKGGSLTEGIVGGARFINPLLAINDSDRDIATLVYSGLMRATANGSLIPDLAESYEISEDGKTYTFIIKANAKFQDGKPVTADDIEFTIQKAQDPALKSPRRANWDGIVVEKVNDREIKFTLKQPYAPFIENTAMGILPKHLWRNVSPEEFAFNPLNIEPVGSGPYKINGVKRNSSGAPIQYKLVAFSKYSLGEAYISDLTIKLYQNESDAIDALNKNDVESINGISAGVAAGLSTKGENIKTAILPRIFGVFFNQNQSSVLANKEVRLALDEAAPRDRIISEVLFGYGAEINSPLPNTLDNDTSTQEERIQNAIAILEKAGWKLSSSTSVMEKKTKSKTETLSFSISTSNTPELKHAAEIIQEEWRKIGANVDLQLFDVGDLNQNVIRPRKYDALFFGEIVGRDRDLYPFWHSSQRNDPGLNIALYVNNKVDKALETARETSDPDKIKEAFKTIQSEVASDTPAVFVYSPEFVYVVPKKIKNIELGEITVASDRFQNIYNWYENTDKVWKIFSKN